mmetsp:Transcript_20096/g.32066  ORF Transcript_20096/g.32066 Transcript_20096/m.32066 type:complete len:247 (+) Transcript_20096:1014-1754(+)
MIAALRFVHSLVRFMRKLGSHGNIIKLLQINQTFFMQCVQIHLPLMLLFHAIHHRHFHAFALLGIETHVVIANLGFIAQKFTFRRTAVGGDQEETITILKQDLLVQLKFTRLHKLWHQHHGKIKRHKHLSTQTATAVHQTFEQVDDTLNEIKHHHKRHGRHIQRRQHKTRRRIAIQRQLVSRKYDRRDRIFLNRIERFRHHRNQQIEQHERANHEIQQLHRVRKIENTRRNHLTRLFQRVKINLAQ